jgi:cell division protein FtsZ
MTAPPLMMPERAAAPEAVAAPAYASAPRSVAQPVLAAATAEEEQPDLYAAPTAAEPLVIQPVARIVDPAVAEAADEPLFAAPAFEERRPRGGFLSIFGSRPRYDAPQPAAAPVQRPAISRGGALPVEAAAPEEEAQQGEDLEIPSFLRRLAN